MYFIIVDSADVLREIPILSIGDIGLVHDKVDVSALQDAIKNMLSGQPAAPISITVPFDTSAAVAAPATTAAHALSGPHTVLPGIVGDNKPHSLQIRFGVRHNWEAGEPVFGLQRLTASNSGYTCYKYTRTGQNVCAVEFDVMGGVIPAWGTAALTAGT